MVAQPAFVVNRAIHRGLQAASLASLGATGNYNMLCAKDAKIVLPRRVLALH